MTILAVLLLALGAADLFRAVDETARGGQLVRSTIVGVAVAVVAWSGAALEWWWLLAILVAIPLWIALTPSRGGIWPVVGLGAIALALVAFDAVLPSATGWLADAYATLGTGGAFAEVPFETFALGVGVVAFLADTSNVVVRVVLQATDSRALDVAPSLKGGRVLGPLERVFIFAMAVAGQYLAITAVVAAKSIIRFPEISKDKHGAKAEYFLIGSFVSWGLALVPVLLFTGG